MEWMEDKFEMEQCLDEKTLVYKTDTYIDGRLVHSHEFDLNPMVEMVEKRILDKLK